MIRNIVIVGGGTAGWMAAAMLSKSLAKSLAKPYTITLVESDDIGTVGVGEATIPPIQLFNRILGLDEAEFMRETQATYKLGIEFVDWRARGHSYVHPFGSFGGQDVHHEWLRWSHLTRDEDFGRFNAETLAMRARRVTPGLNYAFQFDAGLYAAYLRRYAEARGVVRIEGLIQSADQHPDSGFITAVRLKSGDSVPGDLFIDCSGFRGLLIQEVLKCGFVEWTQFLPCDRAVAVPCESPSGPITPYTRSTARDAGWQWRIPLQHRVGNGHVFCSGFTSETSAIDTLMTNLDGKPLKDPKVLRFVTGHRRKVWEKNVVAIGLASGFLEPLESTSIHLAQLGITRLLTLLPGNGFVPAMIERYNLEMLEDYEATRDFLIAHYHVTDRDDTPFWRHCRNMTIPDSLLNRLDIFRHTGHVHIRGGDLFRDASWFSVLVGQGLRPDRWHPAADRLSEAELRRRMA
ncbi:hypothetical protein ABAC460_18980 [Asticcacaulis sp. AC460]|uniref:tryptophan halogenase family protein n=1 Tax=Asticcacaulis sp. AC460 TaxID=1282360 RepID=UPI0003C3C9F9|nr:tryptophan halogenase family protein [Asticcacaulis sp. AC460]ESQ87412.1 hypothetical protein ABAC460_18980 [Asticcacaulis sp. AC460]